MHAIDIDFDVFKQLTILRESENVTYNDVLRKLLKLPPKAKANTQTLNAEGEGHSEAADKVAWVSKGIAFPSGTAFKANYKGSHVTAKVEDGKLLMNGKAYDSLSAAGIAVTGSNVNGWRFWQVKRPADGVWMLAEALRA